MKTTWQSTAAPARVQALASGIAAGAAGSLEESGAVAQGALTYGFGLVMLYGGIGVWVLAVVSFAIVESTSRSTLRTVGDDERLACASTGK